ncbi:hypothetical protein AHAS_Ahas11G0073400 [Arachis hypogaea]
MTWLRDRVAHIPDGVASETLRQYARYKSATLVPLRWLPLLEDFDRCSQLSCEYALLYHTYHSCTAASRNVMDIAGCISLLVSLIYHRFPCFSLAVRCTPYDNVELRQIEPDKLMSDAELYTWRAVVPIVCFHIVEFHHVDRVKRQLGGSSTGQQTQ